MACRKLADELARRPLSEKPFPHLKVHSATAFKFKNQVLVSSEWNSSEAQQSPVYCEYQVGHPPAGSKSDTEENPTTATARRSCLPGAWLQLRVLRFAHPACPTRQCVRGGMTSAQLAIPSKKTRSCAHPDHAPAGLGSRPASPAGPPAPGTPSNIASDFPSTLPVLGKCRQHGCLILRAQSTFNRYRIDYMWGRSKFTAHFHARLFVFLPSGFS